MYDIIKKQNGERFAKAIRNYDNGIFDIPNLDSVVRYAGRDAEPIMQYLISLKNINIVKQSKHHDPIALLNQAGYDAYIADTLEKQNAIRPYFAPGEELCTFRDSKRFENYYIINAVRKDVDSIRRQDFNNPQREDAYGTSVISIQVFKTGGFISIKNRYNHTVESCDNTFNSNPDNIIDGLSDAIQNYFGVDFSSSKVELPRGYVLISGQICKYNTEINNVYIGTDYYATNAKIHPINTQHEVMLGNGLIFDIPTKTVYDVAYEMPDTSFMTNEFQGRIFSQTKDKKTGVRTLMADNTPIFRVLDGEMIYINLPHADKVFLPNIDSLQDEVDFGHVSHLHLKSRGASQLPKLKLNPNALTIHLDGVKMPKCDMDLGGVRHLKLHHVDLSSVGQIKFNPHADTIIINSTTLPQGDADFSHVLDLHLSYSDLTNLQQLTMLTHASSVSLRCTKLPACEIDFENIDSVIWIGADLSRVTDIKFPRTDECIMQQAILPACVLDFRGIGTVNLTRTDMSRVTGIKFDKNLDTLMMPLAICGTCDYDISTAKHLGLHNADMSRVKSLKINPNMHAISLYGVKLPAGELNLGDISYIDLTQADMSRVTKVIARQTAHIKGFSR